MNFGSSFGVPRPSALHRHGGRIAAGNGMLPISLMADSYTVAPGGTIRELPVWPLNVPVMARFEGATTIVNSARLAVTGAANYTTVAGDIVMFIPLGSAGWQAYVISPFLGPATATDEAIARYDGTTGRLLQNSLATLDDAGNAAFTSLRGTITNDDAAAGKIGEIITSTVGNVSLVTATAKTVTSLPLTVGDWDVTGNIGLATATSTNVSSANQSISQTDNTLDTTAGLFSAITFPGGDFVPGNVNTAVVFSPLHTRISLSGPTTIYLIARAGFTVSTCSAYGHLHARRAR
jgi:hypothetical protein